MPGDYWLRPQVPEQYRYGEVRNSAAPWAGGMFQGRPLLRWGSGGVHTRGKPHRPRAPLSLAVPQGPCPPSEGEPAGDLRSPPVPLYHQLQGVPPCLRGPDMGPLQVGLHAPSPTAPLPQPVVWRAGPEISALGLTCALQAT